jgi:nucleoside 2-deoxyribosyltransferase
MSKSVYVTYSHRDVEPDWLRAFVKALQDLNVEAFSDMFSRKIGEDWEIATEKALRASDIIVVVISGAISERSTAARSNIYFELGYALGAGKKVIIVASPSATDLLPSDLQRIQVIRLGKPKKTAREVAKALGYPTNYLDRI